MENPIGKVKQIPQKLRGEVKEDKNEAVIYFKSTG